MKRFTHDADLRGMVVLRSLGFQLVPFKLHRFRKQRRSNRKKAITGERPRRARSLPWVAQSKVIISHWGTHLALCLPVWEVNGLPYRTALLPKSASKS
ncbi:hypothetical protein [Aeromonas salmonicida]|uniref:hypothetical protein n=1 Tax=Aeromonas salmonicida TaxID=645 RepID=UPI0012D930A7|nr:hypothetical protein [Aeromonas salmonicida]